jgi:UDP-N-acetylglucosamine 4,6-dehydratase
MREKGAIPITDRRMTRFWITLDQAVGLVIEGLEKMHGGEVFVPKVPSMNIGDLAEAIAPECRHEVVGIRPGEKLHEVMVPSDDAHRTVELERFYVIQPDFGFQQTDHNWSRGKPVPEGFVYSSNTNTQWLSKEDLRKLLGEMDGRLHHGGE